MLEKIIFLVHENKQKRIFLRKNKTMFTSKRKGCLETKEESVLVVVVKTDEKHVSVSTNDGSELSGENEIKRFMKLFFLLKESK